MLDIGNYFSIYSFYASFSHHIYHVAYSNMIHAGLRFISENCFWQYAHNESYIHDIVKKKKIPIPTAQP